MCAAPKRDRTQQRANALSTAKGQREFRRMSRRRLASSAAHREVGNHDRLALLLEYERTGRKFRDLLEKVYADVDTDDLGSRRDHDLLDDGLTGHGEPLRKALDAELTMVAESIRLASDSVNHSFMPNSPDGVRATTAAILVEKHDASVYRAVRDVFKLPPSNVSDSHERKLVQRVIQRRRRPPTK